MADCLKSNLSVQEPVYCEDASGNVIPDSAMYSWMAVRAAGPNVLKDTLLCGRTTIADGGVESAGQAFYQLYISGTTGIQSDTQPVDSWVNFGESSASRAWTFEKLSTPANDAFGIFGSIETNPVGLLNPPPQTQYMGIYNANPRPILARVTLTCSIAVLIPVTDYLMNIRVSMEASSQPGQALYPAWQDAYYNSPNNVPPPGLATQTFCCDWVGVLQPGEYVTPIMNVTLIGPVQTLDPIPNVIRANMVAEFIDYYDGPLLDPNRAEPLGPV